MKRSFITVAVLLIFVFGIASVLYFASGRVSDERFTDSKAGLNDFKT